jgi:serine/threonine-protein kinase HipA
MSIASYCSIKHADARAVLAEVEHAVSLWREIGKSVSMTTRELDQFADAFEHPERAVAQRIAVA